MEVPQAIFQGYSRRGLRLALQVPLEAIKALLGDPALAEHIVYKPKHIFTNASEEKWVYNEMWTGTWWEETQVSTELVFMMPSN